LRHAITAVNVNKLINTRCLFIFDMSDKTTEMMNQVALLVTY